MLQREEKKTRPSSAPSHGSGRHHPPIKLSRNSSVRYFTEQKGLGEEGEAAADNEGIKKNLGLPNLHALNLIKRVSEAVEQSCSPVGRSSFDRLNSVKADHVNELLQSVTWREFFQVGG